MYPCMHGISTVAHQCNPMWHHPYHRGFGLRTTVAAHPHLTALRRVPAPAAPVVLEPVPVSLYSLISIIYVRELPAPLWKSTRTAVEEHLHHCGRDPVPLWKHPHPHRCGTGSCTAQVPPHDPHNSEATPATAFLHHTILVYKRAHHILSFSTIKSINELVGVRALDND